MSGREIPLAPDALRGARLVAPPLPDELRPGGQGPLLGRDRRVRSAGATVVDVPALAETDETPVLHYEFARDVDVYLSRLPDGSPMRSLADIAVWNSDHATEALKYGQKHVLAALEVDHERDRNTYLAARALDRVVAGEHGIDAVLDTRGADAVVTPSWHGAGLAARAGLPERGGAGGLPGGQPGTVRRDPARPGGQRGAAALAGAGRGDRPRRPPAGVPGQSVPGARLTR